MHYVQYFNVPSYQISHVYVQQFTNFYSDANGNKEFWKQLREISSSYEEITSQIMSDIRPPPRSRYELRFSGLLHSLEEQFFTDVSRKPIRTIFKGHESCVITQ
jgi:hypothetical protein